MASASGLFTALFCTLLMVGAFALATADTVMPSTERWAALTTFGLLALAYTLQGSPELYDALGRTVRHDLRALVSLLLLLPALYISYSLVVDEFTWDGLLTALAFTLLPALAFNQSRRQRTPTLLDLVATTYLLLSLELHLLPALQLPQQGGLVGFFDLSAVPLLLLLLAARGWPGLGFTWYMNWRDLRIALLGAASLLAILVVLSIVTAFAPSSAARPSVLNMLVLAVTTYFLVALPIELLFRGLIQNGIERFAEARLWRGPGSFTANPRNILLQPRTLSLLAAALISGVANLHQAPLLPDHFLLAMLAGLCYGLIYQYTGKVTVSAVAHMLVVWCWTIFFV